MLDLNASLTAVSALLLGQTVIPVGIGKLLSYYYPTDNDWLARFSTSELFQQFIYSTCFQIYHGFGLIVLITLIALYVLLRRSILILYINIQVFLILICCITIHLKLIVLPPSHLNDCGYSLTETPLDASTSPEFLFHHETEIPVAPQRH